MAVAHLVLQAVHESLDRHQGVRPDHVPRVDVLDVVDLGEVTRAPGAFTRPVAARFRISARQDWRYLLSLMSSTRRVLALAAGAAPSGSRHRPPTSSFVRSRSPLAGDRTSHVIAGRDVFAVWVLPGPPLNEEETGWDPNE